MSTVIDDFADLIDKINNEEIKDSLFWLYSNVLGEDENATIRDTFIKTKLCSRNNERCLDMNIKVKDKANSLSLIFQCLRCKEIGKWVILILNSIVYGVN